MSFDRDYDEDYEGYADSCDNHNWPQSYFGGNDSDDSDDDFGYPGEKMSKAERRRREQEVTFSRPDGTTEGKDIGWCISNGFEEIENGLWSGPWYYSDHGLTRPDSSNTPLPGHNPFPNPTEPPRKPIDTAIFQQAIVSKNQGNEEFRLQNYETACRFYDRALAAFPPPLAFLLPAEQKAEKVKIHSNKAECYIRMGRNSDAVMEASAALELDKKHTKSRLRRTKAAWSDIQKTLGNATSISMVNPFAIAKVTDDLDYIIRQRDGEGVREAEAFKSIVDGEMEEIIRKFQIRDP
jgi:hypothetical protein